MLSLNLLAKKILKLETKVKELEDEIVKLKEIKKAVKGSK